MARRSGSNDIENEKKMVNCSSFARCASPFEQRMGELRAIRMRALCLSLCTLQSVENLGKKFLYLMWHHVSTCNHATNTKCHSNTAEGISMILQIAQIHLSAASYPVPLFVHLPMDFHWAQRPADVSKWRTNEINAEILLTVMIFRSAAFIALFPPCSGRTNRFQWNVSYWLNGPTHVRSAKVIFHMVAAAFFPSTPWSSLGKA